MQTTEECCTRIFETTHEGVWIINPEGVTLTANPQMARMLGVAPESLTGRSVLEFACTEEQAKVRRHFEILRHDRRGVRDEVRLRRADGSTLWVLVTASQLCDEAGRPMRYLGMLTDITERKRAEEALRRSEALLQLQIARMPIAHIVWDTDFRVVSWNPAAERIFGYTAAEAIGKHPYDLIVAREDQPEVERVWQRLLQGDSSANSVNPNVTRQGDILICDWSNTPLKDASGAVLGVMSMAQDITDRLRAEQTLRQSHDELEKRVEDRTKRLQLLERELLTVSEREQRRFGQDLHDDLCQQLAGIEFVSQRLTSDLTARGIGGATLAADIAQMVRRALTQTRELARGLSPVRLEEEGLMDALQELATRTRSVFRLDCCFRCETPVLLTDHTAAIHLYRIAQEAVSNAIRHGAARRIEIVLGGRNGSLTMEINDNGVGIGSQPRTGRGMGLQIMDYRAGAIGARLTVEPRVEGGTRVACRLHQKNASTSKKEAA